MGTVFVGRLNVLAERGAPVFTQRKGLAWIAAGCLMGAATAGAQGRELPAPVVISSGWQLQDVGKVSDAGAQVSTKAYETHGWMAATVPGTVLTSLVNDGVYPEPLYGENNRNIPDTLARTPWWYRTTIAIPREYAHRQVWLHFDGANFASDVWVNGTQVGTIQGAFIRGRFDITKLVHPGEPAVIAVR